MSLKSEQDVVAVCMQVLVGPSRCLDAAIILGPKDLLRERWMRDPSVRERGSFKIKPPKTKTRNCHACGAYTKADMHCIPM